MGIRSFFIESKGGRVIDFIIDLVPFRWPAGETDSEFFHYGLAKLGVSLAHLDPKKQGRTMCEVYGAYGWTEGLKLMKWLTDHMLVRGVNYFVPHAFTQKAFPDPDCCLLEFAEQGLAILFIGGLPKRSSEGADVAVELARLAGHQNVKVTALDKLAQELIADGYYEIRVDEPSPYLRSYHYRHVSLEVFMFFNEHPTQTIRRKIALPVHGDVYAYDAFSNRLRHVQVRRENGANEVEVVLHPYESIILLHGADLDGYKALPNFQGGSEMELHCEWTISIAKAEHYPHFEEWKKRTALANMSGKERLPRFTGTFRYETEFEWDETTEQAQLDLGEVYETAQVWINGVEAGVRICPPYCIEINGLIKKGRNKLVIEVTNTLVKEQPDFLSAFAQQEPSGLLGPVRVRFDSCMK
jgi:hypothetical protein